MANLPCPSLFCNSLFRFRFDRFRVGACQVVDGNRFLGFLGEIQFLDGLRVQEGRVGLQVAVISRSFVLFFYSSENIGKYVRHSQPMTVTAATFRMASFKPSRICSPASRP